MVWTNILSSFRLRASGSRWVVLTSRGFFDVMMTSSPAIGKSANEFLMTSGLSTALALTSGFLAVLQQHWWRQNFWWRQTYFRLRRRCLADASGLMDFWSLSSDCWWFDSLFRSLLLFSRLELSASFISLKSPKFEASSWSGSNLKFSDSSFFYF